MHPTINLGFMELPSMGFCILIGTILALITVYLIRRYSSLSKDDVLDGILWAVVLGFIGMKVLFWIVEPQTFVLNFDSLGAFWDSLVDLIGSGMVFYGGLIGGIGGILLVCWRKKKNFFTYSDLFAPCFCLAHAGGRVGCHFSGCCYGMVCESPISVYTRMDEFHLPHLPTQLMEATFLVLLSVTLILIYRKSKHRGTVTSMYLILYAVWRFIIEFFRADERGAVGALSTSQFISIFILIAGIVILILSRRWKKEALPDAEPSDATIAADVDSAVDASDDAPAEEAEDVSRETNDEQPTDKI